MTISFDGQPNQSLRQLKELLEPELDDSFVSRAELDFGNYHKSDLFVQTENYNVFLYRDGGTFHNLDYEDLGQSDEVIEIIEDSYDVDLEKYF